MSGISDAQMAEWEALRAAAEAAGLPVPPPPTPETED